VTKVTISSRLLRLFRRDRSRKQDVVFKMNVLVQIRFECRRGFVKRLVADTRVGRSSVAVFDKQGLTDLQEMRGDHRCITKFGAEEQTWGSPPAINRGE
jgi:hypothetical protein